MDLLTFISHITQSLAWPIAFAVVLICYRASLLQLVSRLIGVKLGDFEATFSNETRQVTEIVAEAKKSLPSIPALDNVELIGLARSSPDSAIIAAWLRIERRLIELASSIDEGASKLSTLRLISLLAERNIINSQVADSLRGLTAMRNLAVHANGAELTTAKAIDFVTLAGTIEILLSTPGLRTARYPKASAMSSRDVADLRVVNVHVTDDTLEVLLRDGRKICTPLAWFPRLVSATPADRAVWEVSGAGQGIHWPKIDEDLSVADLLRGERAPN